MLTNLPAWLRTSPAFRIAIAEARGDAEAERADIAREVARLQVDTDKQLPALERALHVAQAKQADAWTAYERATVAVQQADTVIRALRDRTGAAHRRAAKLLTDAADPCIVPALAAVDHALELHGHTRHPDRALELERFNALTTARRELAALLVATEVDAFRTVADVMMRLGLAYADA